ncbi:MAG: hypothetical protein AAGF54_06830 [Pseudomonadota bacterium]
MPEAYSNIARLEFPKTDESLQDRTGKMRVLLLNGPVGPFFKLLQIQLNQSNFDAWRVCFNAGDLYFSNKEKRISYTRSPDEFDDWLNAILVNGRFDAILFMGSERQLNIAAKNVAERNNVAVLSLEEGYFRPGFITMEEGGNNRSSPLAGRLPPANFESVQKIANPEIESSFSRLVWWGFVYFVFRGLFTPISGRRTFHKKRPLVSEAFFWLRNYKRWLTHQRRNYLLTERLLEKKNKQYYLLPLQVADDTQLTMAGRGWNNDRFLEAAISSFAKHAPPGTELVIKVHPISRGHSNELSNAAALAKLYGAEGRVHVIDTGSLGLLCRHARGMLTINSTSGLAAIAHGTPLFVIGDAIYRHPTLAWCANSIGELNEFWIKGNAAEPSLRQRYLAWISEEAVLSGDFYADRGISAALDEVSQKLSEVCEKQRFAADSPPTKQVIPAAE